MAERTIKQGSFSDVPPDFDYRLRVLIEELQAAIDLREGRIAPGTNTRFVTIADLVEAGVVADGVLR